MLKKASVTIDLISQKVKGSHLIQETVSASFVTNVIELTHDALQSLTPSIIESCESVDMNLRFIKPSQTFYNQVMSLWFKFLHLLQE